MNTLFGDLLKHLIGFGKTSTKQASEKRLPSTGTSRTTSSNESAAPAFQPRRRLRVHPVHSFKMGFETIDFLNCAVRPLGFHQPMLAVS